MENSFSPQAQTVTEVTSIIRGILETELPFVSVLGEISNLRQPYSGHIYFTLKDAGAQLKAVLFKPQQRYLQALPEDGMEVVCRGRISVYEPRGEYQLIVDYLDLKGSGALQIALDRLKKKLADEGLFDQAHKKKIPFLPGKIAVVTSPQGAAVRDFLRIAAARYAGIPITIFPVRVQGEGAADEIVQAINTINAQARADVIVLCRGGGSIEDLWAFNEEKLARAIFASHVPIVSAIGHETDFTIADFVADLRVPTPTAAAEAVIPNKRLLSARVSEAGHRLATAMKRKIDHGGYQVKVCRRMLGDPSSALDHYRLATDHALTAKIGRASCRERV
jgi:exodeoxyribonuclease VII large subunit